MKDQAPPEWHRLFNAALNDELSEADHAQLAALLKASAEARRLWFLYQDNECTLGELRPQRQVAPRQPFFSWLTWRPLTACAAGLFLALFGASVGFGLAGGRGAEVRTPLALAEPGFEDPRLSLTKGFPAASGRWGGDIAKVVSAENGVTPKEGRYMLRLEPLSDRTPRVYQVLDLQALSSAVPGEMYEIEISASFAKADKDAAARYVVRAFAVTEAPEELGADFIERREESIASASRGLGVEPATSGWQALSVKIQVPRTARSLVVLLGVRTKDHGASNEPHYLDDVRVTLIERKATP